MQLPKEISPNPLVNTAIEIRFSSNNSSWEKEKLFSIVYPQFAGDFPNFQPGIPSQVKEKNPNFKNAVDYILHNNEYSFGFSGNSILFGHRYEYKHWGNYYPFIKKNLNKFFSLGIINRIQRIGVRYSNIFDGPVKIENVLDFNLRVPITDYDQSVEFMRLNLARENYKFNVQLGASAEGKVGERSLSGVYVDVDSYLMGDYSPDESIALINDLHNQGKELLFTKLISQSFLKTLNPKY